MNPVAYGPAPYPPPAPAPNALKLIESAAIRAYLTSLVYERTATVDEIELDLAAIRALRARGKSRSALYLFGLLGSLVAGFVLANIINKAPASPIALLLGVGGAIVLGVLWSREPSPEHKRVEMASGFIRRLRLEPGTPIKVKLDLAPLDLGRKKKIDRDETGWSVTYHHDDWLLVEGRIEGGVGFRYTRADSQRRAVQVEVRGNTRITRTRTQGWFHDAVALRFAPDAYPEAALLGPDAYKRLKLPEGFETKHFLGQPGALELTITSDRKWDAGPTGARLDGGDAVMIAGLWLGLLFDLLGAKNEPFQREGDPKPSPVLTLPALDREGVVSGLTHPATGICVLVLPGLLMVVSGANRFTRAGDEGDRAVRLEREAKAARDAKTRESLQKQAHWARDYESDRLMEGTIQLSIGLVMIAAGGGVAGFGAIRRKKKAARLAAEAQLPAQGAPPQAGYPPAQSPYPQQGYPPAQNPYPQQGYPPAQNPHAQPGQPSQQWSPQAAHPEQQSPPGGWPPGGRPG
ncbi:Hypothetical protein A7982_11830 [Minicystis rosea]|nr:Hypothetical protein A7982_11830 [Minicystis rosea]